MQEKIKQQLNDLAEEEYRLFSAKLLPGINNILGVRIPELRKIAKRLSKGNWQAYLHTARGDSFEEIMLQGMVIGCALCSSDERLTYIQRFVPKINNWSICDSFCVGLKFTQTNAEQVWAFLGDYWQSEHAFNVRFAVVMLINYYICAEYIEQVLVILDNIRHDSYYVKMAVAWAVATCYGKLPDRTLIYLQDNRLDDFTYNKSLQKITESLRTDKEEKQRIRLLRRK